MGGPCYLRHKNDTKLLRGPPCTDNFQCVPFMFQGKQWLSAEQAFQAMKFTDETLQERIRSILKLPNETDSSHGMQAWSMGNQFKKNYRKNWDAIKVRMMLDVNRAKYASNPALCEELLRETSSYEIVGANSTEWRHPTLGKQNWGLWNGWIQMVIREEIKGDDAIRDTDLLRTFDAMLQQYEDGYSSLSATGGEADVHLSHA